MCQLHWTDADRHRDQPRRRRRIRRRGFTLIELLVVIGIISLLIGLLMPALSNANRCSRSAADASNVAQIHKSMLVFAQNEPGGRLPTPGLINRAPVTLLGGPKHIPGQGAEQANLNNSANLYSAMVAQRYFNADLLVGPTEVNPDVVVKKDYNFQAYDPATDQYWDSTFKVAFNQVGGVSNTGYAHLALCGERKKTTWRNTTDSTKPLLGTRGTYKGQLSGDNYRLSYTLQLHGSEKEWQGNIAFADNHTEALKTFYPNNVAWECGGVNLSKDNIFQCEFTQAGCSSVAGDGRGGGDTWLCLSSGAPSGPDYFVNEVGERLTNGVAP
jgi:prepilin-type N-terminal cleavage/methylation domain-containing protein